MKTFIKNYFERQARIRAVKLALKADSQGEKIEYVASRIYWYIKHGDA